MADAPVQIPFRRKLIYATIAVLAVVLLCEGALRIRSWIRYGSATATLRDPMLTYDDQAGIFVPRPGYETKGASLHIKINSLGFRGDEISLKKPAGTFRIVCLGASTTFSFEVSSNAATWPHRLQEKLQAAYPDRRIEVVNAAMGGYVAADNLKNLRHRVLPLDPDLVIYYEANNEIVRDTQELAKNAGLIDPSGRRHSPIVATLSRYSLLFDVAYKNLTIMRQSRATAKTLDRIPENLPHRFIGVLDEMRQELATRNVPLLLSTFIVKFRRDQDRATQIANADVEFYYMPWLSIDGMLHAMDVYNSAILEYGKRAGIPVVDDRTAIPPDHEHFTDCMHLADKGNEAMADRFFRFIRAEERVLLR